MVAKMKNSMKFFFCLSLLTSASSIYAQTDLTDAGGKKIGTLVDLPRRFAGDGDGTVVIANGTQPIILRVTRHIDPNTGQPLSSGLIWGASNIFYIAAGCAGQAYLGPNDQLPGARRLAAATKQSNQWWALLTSLSTAPSTQMVVSYYSLSGTGECVNFDTPFLADSLMPSESTILLDKIGLPPFYIK